MSLGKKLAALRKSANITQEALGKQLDLSAQAISKWENDLSEPDMSTLKKLASIYNIPIAEFYDARNTESDDNTVNDDEAYKIVLTGCVNKLAFSRRLRELYNISITEAKTAIDFLPCTVEYTRSFNSAEKIKSELEKTDGTTVEIKKVFIAESEVIGNCADCNTPISINNIGHTAGKTVCKACREMAIVKKPPEKEKKVSKFGPKLVIAHICGGIAALIWLIAIICNLSKLPLHPVLSIAIGIVGAVMFFATVFQLFYETAVRNVVMYPIDFTLDSFTDGDSDEGCFIFALFWMLKFLLGVTVVLAATVIAFVIASLFSPFTYTTVLKKQQKIYKQYRHN